MPRYNPLNKASMYSRGLLRGPNATQNLLGMTLPANQRNTQIAPAQTGVGANLLPSTGQYFGRSGSPQRRERKGVGQNVFQGTMGELFAKYGGGPQGGPSAVRQDLGVQPMPSLPTQQTQQTQQAQGGASIGDVTNLARAGYEKFAGPQGPAGVTPATLAEQQLGAAGGLAPSGPEGILAPAQSFFGRTFGAKGSDKRSNMSRAMIEAGARMMKGSTEGTFATIGEGITAGTEAYDEAKGMRAWEEDRTAKEEARRLEGEDRARRIIAEDLATSQAAGRREAYGKIMPVDPETGERGEFNMEAWDDAWATALHEGDTDFAIVLTQMRPEDPEEIPLGDWKEANGPRQDESGAWRKVFYRTAQDGTVETQLSEYTVAPPAGARAGGAGGVGGQFQKEENLGRVSLAAINSLVDTGGWMSLAGWVRDDEAFDELQGQILIDNPDATAVQIMEATRSAWSKAEGYLPEESWIGEDGELQLGDEAAMMINMVLSDPSGSSDEGDWMPTKYLKAKLQEWSQSNSAGAAYATATAHALQAINPLVRYLSGAQMTNREAMRYYGAVIPSWGDSQQTVNAKMRGLSLLARAMGGDIAAMERVDMSGFVDDPNLTAQKNIEARGEWAQAQLTRVVMEEESSALRGANVEAAQARTDADAAMAALIAEQEEERRRLSEPFSLFRTDYTPTAEERALAGMPPG